MRKRPLIPRILKITKVHNFKVFCVFNNGEHRIIDFKPFFKQWNLSKKKKDFRYPLLKKNVFDSVSLSDNTLAWESIRKKIKLSSGKEFDVAFELDPIVLYDKSIPDPDWKEQNSIGKILKIARKEAGLTQEELAKRSGTTRYYISRIENDRSDIEFGTLKKIIEIGLNKKLQIKVS